MIRFDIQAVQADQPAVHVPRCWLDRQTLNDSPIRRPSDSRRLQEPLGQQ